MTQHLPPIGNPPVVQPEHGASAAKPERFRLRIDKGNYETDRPLETGRQLLALAGKTPPEQYQVFRKMKGGELVEIGLDETVDLRDPGVERFVTLPLDQTEGEGPALRRAFPMPEADGAFLDSLGLLWETVRDGTLGRLVIHDYPVPAGYTVDRVRLNLRIEPLYPETQIDMAYVTPALVRRDGVAINNLADDPFDGIVWQRWSRHRTPANPWRPGVDDVSTHLALVDHWFAREFTKKG